MAKIGLWNIKIVNMITTCRIKTFFNKPKWQPLDTNIFLSTSTSLKIERLLEHVNLALYSTQSINPEFHFFTVICIVI